MFHTQHLLVIVPLALSSLAQLLFPSDFQQNKKVFFQPPGYVFGVVWTVLYLMLGVYLYRMRKGPSPLIMLLFFSNLLINLAWTPVVNIWRRYVIGVYMIASLLLTTFLMIVLEQDRMNKALLVPYATWLLFAMLINIELARLYAHTLL